MLTRAAVAQPFSGAYGAPLVPNIKLSHGPRIILRRILEGSTGATDFIKPLPRPPREVNGQNPFVVGPSLLNENTQHL